MPHRIICKLIKYDKALLLIIVVLINQKYIKIIFLNTPFAGYHELENNLRKVYFFYFTVITHLRCQNLLSTKTARFFNNFSFSCILLHSNSFKQTSFSKINQKRTCALFVF